MSRTTVYETELKPASGGFDMWQPAPESVDLSEHLGIPEDDSITIESYLDYLRSDIGVIVEATNELDGLIYNQNGRQVYRSKDADGEDAAWQYFMLEEEKVCGAPTFSDILDQLEADHPEAQVVSNSDHFGQDGFAGTVKEFCAMAREYLRDGSWRDERGRYDYAANSLIDNRTGETVLEVKR